MRTFIMMCIALYFDQHLEIQSYGSFGCLILAGVVAGMMQDILEMALSMRRIAK